MFSRIERWNSETSCGTTAIAARSEFLGKARQGLAVHADLAALDVLQAQQKADQRGLACTRSADQANLLARPNGEKSSSKTTRPAA